MITKWVRDGRFSVLFRILLVVYDIIAINLSSYLALLIRFELRWTSVEQRCIEEVYNPLFYILNIVITLVLFFIYQTT